MILVTGSTGYVGSRVASNLASRGADVTALVRDAGKALQTLPAGVPVRVADYDRPDRLAPALLGVDELVLIPSDGPTGVLRRHAVDLIDAARAARVRRVVFLSIADLREEPAFYCADAYCAEAAIRDAFDEWVILRCGLYADLVADRWIRPAKETGVVELPAEEGRVALISRATVASALAAATLHRGLAGEALTLTGPSALTFGDVARQATAAL